MTGSRNMEESVILAIYMDKRTVFRLNDVAMLTGEDDFNSLNRKLNYQVRKGKLGNPRKGIYTKPDYDVEEMACRIFTPSYISLDYILAKAGVIFQYDPAITSVSYLSRNTSIEGKNYMFRRIKGEILVNTEGISRRENHVNIATAERAFLDQLYLDPFYYFDNLSPLSKELIFKLLPLYSSKALRLRVEKLLQDA